MTRPPDDPERLARLGLTRLCEPGSHQVHAAIAELGSVEVWERLRRGEPCGRVSEAARAGAKARAEGYDPRDDLRRLERVQGRLLAPGDEEWPAQLSWEPSLLRDAPPLALHARGPGRLDQLVERSVAVVGARAATAYGVHVAQELGHGLAERGVCVVSGGAYGIDVAAHRGALASEQTPTIAVLACGVDVVYPRGNDRVLARIAATGLVVSELPPGSAPTRVRFLVRNRLIAALTLGTVVVEAALRSGSLATVERASSLRKVCMAVPGPVTSAMSAGCHDLLRRAEAVLVCDAEQVLDAAGRLGDDAAAPVRGRADPRDGLSETVRRVLDAVPVRAGAGEASIARTAGIAPLVVQQVLPPLEIHGLVERCSTGWRLTALGVGRPSPVGR